jgi:hypothetical protein
MRPLHPTWNQQLQQLFERPLLTGKEQPTMSHSIERDGERSGGNRLPLEKPKLKAMKYILFVMLMLGMVMSASLGTSKAKGDVPLGSFGADSPEVAYNSTDDEYLVVWRDTNGVDNNANIYGQRVSSNGTLLGIIAIYTGPDTVPGLPAVTYNSTSNEYLVAWLENRNGGSNYDIYGQRVSGSGALLGSDIPISTAPGNQYYPEVAYDNADNEYLVVWQDDRNGASNYDIYGQRLSGIGALLGGGIPISAATGRQQWPVIAYNSINNEYLVAWEDDRLGTSNSEIYGQRLSGIGALLGSDIPISAAPGDQYASSIAYNNAANEYLITWAGGGIQGQRVSGNGALLGSAIPISTGFSTDPAIASNGAGNEYLITWAGSGIQGQRVSGNGALLGSEIAFSDGTNFRPAVAHNGAGTEYLVIWELYGSPSTINGQRASDSGALVGSNFAISTGEPAPTSTPGLPTATSSIPTSTSSVPTGTPTPPPDGCTNDFIDVPAGSTFHSFVRCLACQGVISGYADGTFRPQNNLTRGQLAKIVSNSANFTEPHTSQTFEDVAADHTFYIWIERLASRGIIGGYECGGEGEPCVAPENRPYFRPGNNVTRGQTAKIVAIGAGLPMPPEGSWTFQDVPEGSTFWQWIDALSAVGAIGGYDCGGEGEPCIAPDNRPYFRAGNNVTRGQASKIVANTFFPNCQTP